MNIKKTMVLSIIIGIAFSMIGCGKNNSDTASNVEVPDNREMVYEGKTMMLTGIEDPIDSFEIHGDKLYFTTALWIPDEETDKSNEELSGTQITGFYYADVEGNDVKEIKTVEWEEKEFFSFWEVSEDGNIIYVTGNISGEKGSYSISKMDISGKEIFKRDITETTGMNPYDDKNISLVIDKNDNIVIASESGAFIFDNQAKFIEKVKPDGVMNGWSARTKKGDIVCAGYDGEKFIVMTLDVDKKMWSKKYELSAVSGRGIKNLLDGVEYDFYYTEENGIYGYDISKEKAVKLVDYTASNMTDVGTDHIYPVGKDKLIGFETGGAANKLVVYNKVDPATVQERQTIVLGGNYIDATVKEQVAIFNKQNKNYMIEIKDYCDDETLSAEDKINADIIAGHAPDILYLNNAPLALYDSKGLLEDLTPYYENDIELSVDDIIPGVLEGMKINNKICFVSSSFGVSSVAGRTEDVGSNIGWTFEDMQSALEKKETDIAPFVWEDKVGLLWSFNSVYDDYIDWETGKCNFDSKEFKSILELVNQGKFEADDTDGPVCRYEKIKDGSVLLANSVVTLDRIQVLEELFEGEITFVGYPCKEKTGSYFCFDNMLGISSTSDVKEGAWGFLRTFMTRDYQDSYFGQQDLTRIDSFKKMADKKMQANFYAEEYCDSFGDWCDYFVELKPLTEQQVDKYMELINHTKSIEQNNMVITNIIMEEAQAYFMGDKSVDETAEIIQNRVTTYVNENR